MLVAVIVGVGSLIPTMWMIESAVSEGFGVLVLPLIALEVLFLLAVFCVWRALADDEDAPQPPRHSPFLPPPEMESRHSDTYNGVRSSTASDRQAGSTWSAWAEWWFNGLRDPRGP